VSLAVLVGAVAAVFRGGGADAPPPVGSAAGMVLILLQSAGVLAAVAAAAWGHDPGRCVLALGDLPGGVGGRHGGWLGVCAGSRGGQPRGGVGLVGVAADAKTNG